MGQKIEILPSESLSDQKELQGMVNKDGKARAYAQLSSSHTVRL